jgi:anhydro-N-acetylmuramic acid kinase
LSTRNLFRSGPLRVLGLNSGTSMDALDWALVEFRGAVPHWKVVAEGSRDLPTHLRRALEYAASAEEMRKETLVRTDVALGDWLGEIVLELSRKELRGEPVDLVASHGQTVGHWPFGGIGATLQIGDPDHLAKTCGLPVVSHFRQGDVAVGGEGAPLTPGVNRLLFARPRHAIAILNLGGMANLSVVPPARARRTVIGTDCGPANRLLDIAARLRLDRPWDATGKVAMRGEVDTDLLAVLKRHPWFKRSLPASCGREEFNDTFLADSLKKAAVPHSADLLATLCAFSAWGVARAVRLLDVEVQAAYASGGGVYNTRLMAEIEEALAPVPLTTVTRLGVHPDSLEAVSFAVLGYLCVRGRALDLRAVTGARRPAVLGRVSWP